MVDSLSRATTLPHAQLDIVLRDVVGTGRRDASAALHDEQAHELLEGAHAAATGIEAVGAGIELLEVGGVVGSGSVSLAGAAGLAIVGTYATWVGAILEGEQRGIAYDSEMMRGALAVFEGRLDDPETRVEMQQNPAFRDGAGRAERLYYTDHERFLAIASGVRNVAAQGAESVYRGRDAGPAFEHRYEQELPFRHAVDEARALRAEDPAAFEAARRDATQLRESMERGRGATPLPG
jgi:hypothetical protein